MNLNSATSTFFVLELDVDDAASQPALELLAQLVATQPSQLLEDATDARASALNEAGEVDLLAFAEDLARRGHHIWLRTGRHDKCTQVSLRHTFVVASGSGDTNSNASGEPELFVVVDPSFKDSFRLCNPTPAYSALWDALPDLFVGTAAQLVPLVEFLCTQIQMVFAETASSCPPWRQPAVMITKWLPTSVDDVEVVGSSAARSGSPLAAAPATQQQQQQELSRSSSATSSGSNSFCGLRTLSSCYAAIISSAASANPAAAAAAAAADGVLTPRAGRPPGYDRSNSSNILLSGSLEDLGAAGATAPLDFAAAGFTTTATGAPDDQGCWGAACIVQAVGSLSPGGKLACFGASWGRGGGCVEAEDDNGCGGGGSSCEYGSSFLCPDVGGVAIKVAAASKVAGSGRRGAAACKDFRIPAACNPPALTPQHSDASSGASVTPRAGAGGRCSGLDMTRFNSDAGDLDVVLQGRDMGLPVQRSVSEMRAPASKRPAGSHLLRQCSALSAAIAAGSACKL